MKKLMTVALSASVLMTAVPAMADYDYQQEKRKNEQRRQQIVMQTCGSRDKADRLTSTLLSGPDNYSEHYPVLGRLAGEVEHIAPFKEQGVVDEVFTVLRDSAIKRRRMIRSTQFSSEFYDQKKAGIEGTPWDRASQGVMEDSRRSAQESLEYITSKAVKDTRATLKGTAVWIPRVKPRTVAPKERRNYSRKELTHKRVNAYSVFEGCRLYWEHGFRGGAASGVFADPVENEFGSGSSAGRGFNNADELLRQQNQSVSNVPRGGAVGGAIEKAQDKLKRQKAETEMAKPKSGPGGVVGGAMGKAQELLRKQKESSAEPPSKSSATGWVLPQ